MYEYDIFIVFCQSKFDFSNYLFLALGQLSFWFKNQKFTSKVSNDQPIRIISIY